MLLILLMTLITCTLYPDNSKDLYLDLMKKCLINSIYEDTSYTGTKKPGASYDQQKRENGLDWPLRAHTMIGLHRLDNLQFCVEDVLQNNIPGDLIETGVWRGGATIFMRAILKAYDDTDRKVFVADSFKGLPKPNAKAYPSDKNFDLSTFAILAIPLAEVRSNFARYGLLDSQVIFLPGLFSQTLPKAPIKQLAIMRLDGDLYESTMDALVHLYPKLSVGGYVIIDDYHAFTCCAQAVNDFRNKYKITDKMHTTKDNIAVFWKRTQ